MCDSAVDTVRSCCRVSVVEPSSTLSRECPSTPPPAKKPRIGEDLVDYEKKTGDLNAMEVDA